MNLDDNFKENNWHSMQSKQFGDSKPKKTKVFLFIYEIV